MARNDAEAASKKNLILRSAPKGARLEGWPQTPWFETRRCATLLTMRALDQSGETKQDRGYRFAQPILRALPISSFIPGRVNGPAQTRPDGSQ
jgi:hypothetical protein